MSEFSISFQSTSSNKKKVGKKSKAKKKQLKNLFQDEPEEYRKKDIKLSVVENKKTEEEIPQKDELIIKPIGIPELLVNETIALSTAVMREEVTLKYGLNQVSQTDTVTNNEHYDQRFSRILDKLPDETKLEEYEHVPIADFGLALLRGMGWDGTEDNGSTNTDKATQISGISGPEFTGIGVTKKSGKASTPTNGNAQKPKKHSLENFMPFVKVPNTQREKSNNNNTNDKN